MLKSSKPEIPRLDYASVTDAVRSSVIRSRSHSHPPPSSIPLQITFAFSFSACFSSVFAFQSVKNYEKQYTVKDQTSITFCNNFISCMHIRRQNNLKQPNCKESSLLRKTGPYLGSNSLITVFIRSALQCKLFPLSHAALFHSSVMMNHLTVYQLLLFPGDFQRLAPLIEHARNLQKMVKLTWTGFVRI